MCGKIDSELAKEAAIKKPCGENGARGKTRKALSPDDRRPRASRV